MIKFFSALFLIFVVNFQLSCNSSFHRLECDSQLQCYISKIEKIPEAKILIENTLKEGPLRIEVRGTDISRQFGAFWDRDARAICIAEPTSVPESAVIGSLLFELHNASIDSKFDALEQQAISGRMSKSIFIEKMEHLEYVNSLNTAKVAEKGIAMGIIPAGSRLPTYSSFKEHFAAQQASGHSACFAQYYDSLRPGRA